MWDIGFHGQPLDDRGRLAIQEMKGHTKRMCELTYDPANFEMELDGRRFTVDDFRLELETAVEGSVLLEATTLGFVEILSCSRTLYKTFGLLDILYVEPISYRSPRSQHLLHRRDFELSDEVPGYRGIPGNSFFLGSRHSPKCVFLLGYEDSRLRRAFEDLQEINPSQSNLVIGVPAFQPGWETDVLANNIGVIREHHILGDLHYCGAANPAAVVDILSRIHNGLQNDERLFVAPIGTKPHGIGAALFVLEHPEVGLLYDHPQRLQGRSTKVGNWHLFSVSQATVASR